MNIFYLNAKNRFYVIWGKETNKLYFRKQSVPINCNNIKTIVINNDYYDMVSVEGPHVIYRNSNPIYIDHSSDYYYEKDLRITNNCLNQKLSLYVNADELKNFSSIAEIGCRYGSSSSFLVNNCNKNAKVYLYEKVPQYCKLIVERLGEKANYTIYEGDASQTLKENNIYFDMVFFDCSHKKDIDESILKSLLNHIDNNTLLIFDDYDKGDIKYLIDEFINTSFCKIRYKDDGKIVNVKGKGIIE